MNTRIIRGLLWREWLLHHASLTWIFSAWLFGIWVFPMHPAFFILPFGLLSACMIAGSFGGADAIEGSEEFSFALPPTRSQRYLLRLAFGGGVLAFLVGSGALAGALDLPQRVWGLFFESGFTQPFAPHENNILMYALAIAGSMAVFSEAFVAGSSCRTPEAAGAFWLRGLFVPGIFAGGAFLGEGLAWHRVTGWISVPVLALWALGRLCFGYRDYIFKEGVTGLPPLVRRNRLRFWVTLLIAIVLVLVVLGLMVVRGEPAHP